VPTTGNCPAIHLRRPAPFSAGILRANSIMVVNVRHEFTSRCAVVLRLRSASWTS
jgi:hypothetical protein